MNGRRISIRSLLYYMLRKLWLILALAAIFGLLLAGYKYKKDKASNAALKKEETGSNLTESECSDVENAALQYRYAMETEAYLNTSPLLQINSKEEEQVIVEYRMLLDTGAELSTGTVENAYLQLLRSYINDGMYISDLTQISHDYDKHAFLKELIWCNNSGGGEFTLGVIRFPQYPKLAEDVRTVVETYMEKLMKEEPRLKITPMKEGTVFLYDATTDSAQKSTYSNMVSYRRAYMNAYTGFTAAQQSYFRYLTGYMKEDTEEEVKDTKPVFSWKFLVVGAVVGLAGGVALCFILLFLSSKHATPSDYSENLGLRNFGLITTKGAKRHPVREWFMKKELKTSLFDSDEESVEYAAVRIAAYCDNHGVDKIAVLSSDSTDAVQSAVSDLTSALRRQEVDLIATEKVGKDSRALTELVSTGQCILVEQLRGGNRLKAAELLQFCKENDVDVIGAVGVMGASVS
ncbi:MAG: hypothetical protein K5897_00070 [Eubacterium sp.]|nr:hypothetical protein [Eubacterium sp.]